MENEQTVRLIEEFLNEKGLWWDWKDWLDEQGYTLADLGMSEE